MDGLETLWQLSELRDICALEVPDAITSVIELGPALSSPKRDEAEPVRLWKHAASPSQMAETSDSTGATPEEQRVQEAQAGVPWRTWGPCLSERQWRTVREDHTESGDARSRFTRDQARSRPYRRLEIRPTAEPASVG